jgi:SM-20-related protein
MPSLDAAEIARLLRTNNGVAVIDAAFGADFANKCRSEAAEMLQCGGLAPANISSGLGNEVQSSKRGDLITWLKLQSADDPARENYLQRVLVELDKLRQQLESDVGVQADSCSFMLACYPGGGARYVKHRDADPERPGRKLTVIYYLNPDWQPEHGGCLRIWPMTPGAASHALAGGPALGGGALGGGANSLKQIYGAIQPKLETARRCLKEEDRKTLLEQIATDLQLTVTIGKTAAPGENGPDETDDTTSATDDTTSSNASEPLVVEPRLDRILVFISTMEHEVLPSFAPRFALTSWLYSKRDMYLELVAEERQMRRQEDGDKITVLAPSAGDGAGVNPLQRMAMKYRLQAALQAEQQPRLEGCESTRGGGAINANASVRGGANPLQRMAMKYRLQAVMKGRRDREDEVDEQEQQQQQHEQQQQQQQQQKHEQQQQEEDEEQLVRHIEPQTEGRRRRPPPTLLQEQQDDDQDEGGGGAEDAGLGIVCEEPD